MPSMTKRWLAFTLTSLNLTNTVEQDSASSVTITASQG